jgi:hypothetical protein
VEALTLGCLLYQLTTETGMPHLEENLRYATTEATRCLTRSDLATVFPILSHPALHGCALRPESESDDSLTYILGCEGSRDTTGSARWDLSAEHLRGTLNVRLGGKNMTFYQRVTARLVSQRQPASTK